MHGQTFLNKTSNFLFLLQGNTDLGSKILVESGDTTSADDSTSNIVETHVKPTSVTESDDWMLIGTALDRVCFILYCLAFVIICISSFA